MQIQNLCKEGKGFISLKREYDGARFPPVGTVAYIISTEWMDKYKKFIFYDDLKYNDTPDASDDHLTAMHPGPINNAGLLQQEEIFLKGTGTVAELESDLWDTYLHKDTRERMHFEFYNKEIWDFLNNKYGSDHAIKRYYINKGTYSTFSELDARLTRIPVSLLTGSQLYEGQVDLQSFKPNYV